jgi:hypothetical protein
MLQSTSKYAGKNTAMFGWIETESDFDGACDAEK